MKGRVRGTPRRGELRLALVAVCSALVVGTAAASAPAGSAASKERNGPYSLALTALTGPRGADLALTVEASPDAAAVEAFKKVQLKIFGATDVLPDVRNLKDVALDNGTVDVQLGQIPRDRRIEVDVLVQTSPDLPTYVLTGETRTRLRPDLIVADVAAPKQTTTARAIDVFAEIDEVNGDTGATATATLMLGPTPLADPVPITVDAGKATSVTFHDVKLTSPVVTELSVFVSDASPAETDDTNNVKRRIVDVTENELVVSNVLVPSLGGYGAQFCDHVYAPISGPPANVTDMETKVRDLDPQIVRIFYNDNWDEPDGTRPDWQKNLESFYRVVGLAQSTGATINITFHTLVNALKTPEASMHEFADALEYVVRDLGYTNVRWASVGNEVNAGAAKPETWAPIFRALDAELQARGLRDQIHLVGPDLVESGPGGDHRAWTQYTIDSGLVDRIDAWSEHIYWVYDRELTKMERRIRDVHKLFTTELPAKPNFLWEFGVRGKDPNLEKLTPRYAYYEDGSFFRTTNVAAFQTLWFFIESAQLGFTGVSKWDAYWGMYDTSSKNNQWNWSIGPPEEGWPLYPNYYATHLLYATTESGWQVLQVGPWQADDWQYDSTGATMVDPPEKELVAYSDGNGLFTVTGLDTHARLLNTVSDQPPPEYSIGGLPANTTFNLAVWNATGDGKNTIADPVTTNAAGVARFAVPLQAAFALTTLPVQ
jgi:hypothetical protein